MTSEAKGDGERCPECNGIGYNVRADETGNYRLRCNTCPGTGRIRSPEVENWQLCPACGKDHRPYYWCSDAARDPKPPPPAAEASPEAKGKNDGQDEAQAKQQQAQRENQQLAQEVSEGVARRQPEGGTRREAAAVPVAVTPDWRAAMMMQDADNAAAEARPITFSEAREIALAEVERSERRFAEATAVEARPEGRGCVARPATEIDILIEDRDHWKAEAAKMHEKLRALETSLIAAEAERDEWKQECIDWREAVTRVRAARDLSGAQLLMVGSELFADGKLDPEDKRDPRWTPTLEQAAKLRRELTAVTAERDEWKETADALEARWVEDQNAKDSLKSQLAAATARAEKAEADNADLMRTIAQNQGVYRENLGRLEAALVAALQKCPTDG